MDSLCCPECENDSEKCTCDIAIKGNE